VVALKKAAVALGTDSLQQRLQQHGHTFAYMGGSQIRDLCPLLFALTRSCQFPEPLSRGRIVPALLRIESGAFWLATCAFIVDAVTERGLLPGATSSLGSPDVVNQRCVEMTVAKGEMNHREAIAYCTDYYSK
ncbi:MAG: hypothetical protein QF570_07000, partial [Myxococcota bacterium]|nr:hypothetical protein [Myxococcota bacterium]